MPSQLQGVDIANMDHTNFREILDRPGLTEVDVVRLNTERFGTPKSKLQRQPKAAPIDAIHSAMSNAEALSIISEEARRGGNRRWR